MTDRLYESDPETWLAHLAEGNARQPRKRVAADVIIRNQAGRLLLVNPNYKPDWDVPGGMAEANESPIDAARREIREELGLTVAIRSLLCIDWVPPHGPWDDTLVFVFDGGQPQPGPGRHHHDVRQRAGRLQLLHERRGRSASEALRLEPNGSRA